MGFHQRYVHENSPGFSGKLFDLQEIIINRYYQGNNFYQEYFKKFHDREIAITEFADEAVFVIKELDKLLSDSLEMIYSSLPFFKSYEIDDPMHKRDTIRYYDEREWRAAKNSDIDYLQFEWSDISFILCNDEAECDLMAKKIIDLKDILKITNDQ
jgi:hypothetical protein